MSRTETCARFGFLLNENFSHEVRSWQLNPLNGVTFGDISQEDKALSIHFIGYAHFLSFLLGARGALPFWVILGMCGQNG